MAKAYDTRLVDIFDPEGAPARGMNTSMSSFGLQDGWFPLLSNLRLGDGTLRCRGGMSASLGTILASSSYRGHWSGFLWGSYCVVVAVDDASATRIYRSTDMATWTELTVGSGAVGSTRLSTGDYPCIFTVVPNAMNVGVSLFEIANTEVLVVSNGQDAPRIIQSGPISGTSFDIAAPAGVSQLDVQVRTIEYSWNWQVANSYSEVGNFTWATNGTAPNMTGRLSFTTTIELGDTATIAFTTGSNVLATFDQDRQLLLGVDTAYSNLWDKLKVEFGPTGSEIILWDPANPNNYARPIPISVDNSQKTIWAFRVPKRTSTWSSVSSLKFTWAVATNQAPTAAKTVDFFLCALTYAVASTANFKIAASYSSSYSLQESPAAVYSGYTTQLIKNFGGPIYNEMKLPPSPLLKAIFYAPVPNTSTTVRNLGVNKVNFFVQKAPGTKYLFWHQGTIATYSDPNWSFSNGTAEAEATWILAGPDSTTTNVYPVQYMPDEYHIAVPKATCAKFTNGRLYVGKKAGTKSQLMVSQYGNPFRCRALSAIASGSLIPDAPLVLELENETVTNIIPISASTLGASVVYIVTDQNVYATGGTDSYQIATMGRVANIGSKSPYSIVADKGTLYFLDNEMQTRILSGGQIGNITRDIIEATLKDIPGARRKWVGGEVFDDLYYLPYTPSAGTTNTKIFIYDQTNGAWVQDTPPKACEALVKWFDGTNKVMRLIALALDSTTMKAYEYDLLTQTQDLGTTNISVGITTKEYREESGKALFINRIGVTCDDVASSTTNAIVRTYKPDGATGTSNLSLDGSGNQIVQYDGSQTIAGNGNGISAQIGMTLSMTAGKRIYKIVAELEPRDHVYTRSS